MLKRILSIITILAMISAFFAIPSIAVSYSIQGDSLILASHDSTIKVDYSLFIDDVVTDAEWSLSSDDTSLPAYVSIDEDTGELFVSKNALGRNFKVIASIAGEMVAEKDVVIADNCYFEDFENEGDVDTAITSSFFSTKSSATVVANGTGKAAKTSVKLNSAGTAENHTMFNQYNLKVDLPENFEPKQYSISADVKVDLEGTTIKSGWTLFGLNYVDESGVACVAPARARVESYVADNKARIRVYTDQSSGSSAKTQNDIPFTFNEFIPLNVTVDGNSMNLNVNGQTISNQTLKPCKNASGSYVPVTILNQIGFGTYIDNIEIYSGVKTDYNDFLIDVITDIPENIAIADGKEISRKISVATIPAGEEVVWGTDNSDVYIENDRLIVSEGASGSAILTATLFEGEDNETTKEFTVNITEAISTDFENESVGGNIVDEDSNLYFTGSRIWNIDADGAVVLSAKVKGNGKLVLLGDDIEIDCQFGEQWKDVFAFIDTFEDSYIVIVDGKTVDNGDFYSNLVTGAEVEELCIDDIYIGSAFVAAPMVIDAEIEGIVSAGQTVTADYRYFSSSGFEKESVDFEWFISDSETEIGRKISYGETFKIKDEYIEKYLTVGIKCSDENGGESETVYSLPQKIQDLFTVTALDGKFKFELVNPFGELVYPFAVLYNNDVISDIRAMKLAQDFDELSFELPVSEYTGAIVYMLDKNFAPLSGIKTFGEVPDIYSRVDLENKFEEKNGVITLSTSTVQPASLFIFNSSVYGSFESTFSIEELPGKIQNEGTSLIDCLSFAGVTETGFSIIHSITDSGAYKATAVLKDGNTLSHTFSVNFEEFFDGTEDVTKESFVKVMKNFTDIEEPKLNSMYDVYSDIEDKSVVAGFVKAESDDSSMLEVAFYLSAFLENKENKETLLSVLAANELDTEPVELMSQNNRFDLTRAALPAPCKVVDFLNSMREKAILLGIKNAADYTETKVYLLAVNPDKVTDSMANRFMGISFSTIQELEEAINSYIPAGQGTIVGNTSLFIPPNGRISANEYILKDSDGNTVKDAVFTLDGEYEGVSLKENKLILDGSKITILHTIVINASSLSVPEITGKLTVKVQNMRYYEDFEDATDTSISEGKTVRSATVIEGLDGTTSQNLLHSSTTSTVAKETNGNIYAHGSVSDKKLILAYYSGKPWINEKIMTIAVKVKFTGERIPGAFSVGSDSVAYINITDEGKIESSNDKNGYSSSTVSNSYILEENVWTELRIVLNYTTFTYDFYAGEKLIFDDFSMARTAEGALRDSSGGLERFYLRNAMFDDIIVCSGELIMTDVSADIPKYIAVSTGKEISRNVVEKTTPIGEKVEWTTSNEKIYIKDGRLIVSDNVSTGIVVLSATIMKGTEYETTREFTVNITEAISTDFENETVGGNIVEEDSNLYFDGSGNWSANIDGAIMLSAKVKGSGKLILHGDRSNIETSYTLDENKWYNAFVFADTDNNTYISVLDNKIVDRGEFLSDLATGFSTDSLSIDDVYMGTAYTMEPISLDVYVKGVVGTAQTVTAGYEYFSSNNFEEKGREYAWYVADSISEQGILVSNEKNFKIGNEYANKYLRVGVKPSDGVRTGEMAISEPVKIQKLLTVTEMPGKFQFSITNPFGNITLYPFAVLYNNGKISDIRAIRVEATSSELVCQLNVGDYSGAVVYLLNEDFMPLSDAVKFGEVPMVYTPVESENKFKEENGIITFSSIEKQTGSLFVFKPNIAGNFEYTYSTGTISQNISETGSSLTEYLAFAGLTDAGVSFSHSITEPGVYCAKAFLDSEEELTHIFGVGFNTLFESDEFKTSSEGSFMKIMSNFTDFEEPEIKELYTAFISLSDKNAVAEFMKAEDYNMAFIKEAIYIPAFLENITYKDSLITALSANGFDKEAVELMAMNSRFDLTKSALPAPCKFEDFLKIMKEKAILLGVENSVNYTETKVYLIATKAGKISDNMARELTGTKYTSLESLIDAIKSFNQGQGGGSSGGSSGGVSGIDKSEGIVVAPQRDEIMNINSAFTDISEKHWAYEYIAILSRKNIINGYSDGSYMPDKNITRAEFVKVISATFGLNGNDCVFSDVSEADWYYPYVSAAYTAGVINGDNGSFRPNDTISREEAATVIYRVIKSLNMKLDEKNTNPLNDIKQVSEYAQEAVKFLNSTGIITGMDNGDFSPRSGLTRAQIAAVLYRTVSR